MNEVIVVGSGPTGMMLAGELALGGGRCGDRGAAPDAGPGRLTCGGFHSRTIEVLDQRGIVDRFLAEGQIAQAAGFARTTLDLGDLPTRHPYSLGLWQNHIERILVGWVEELGVPIRRGREVTGFVQDDAGVDVLSRRGRAGAGAVPRRGRRRAQQVRKAAGIDFPGWEATRSNLIAEVEVTEETPTGVRIDGVGIHGLQVLEDGRTVRVVVTEQTVGPATEPTLADLSAALTAVYGTDFGVHDPTWISRFTDATRQAAAYRSGRVLIAGDAAHIHSPAGGQGIGLGVQDAVNLGWKLAQVVRGISPDSLLDTYHAERHPAEARVLQYTMAQSVMQRADPRIGALRGPGRATCCRSTRPARGSPGSSPASTSATTSARGTRCSDGACPTSTWSLPVPGPEYSLLHDARAVLLDLGEPGSLDITPWADRVRHIDAEYTARWELPVIGTVTAPVAVLIRPDGQVAWEGDGTQIGLSAALTTWFGQPASRDVV